MTRLSMLELGRRLGVDRATVSRALSEDKAHLVAAATRERIRREAARLGFSPDAAAATLRRGRSRTIGILTPDLLNEVLVRVIRGTVAYLNRNTAEASRIIPLIGETGDRPEEFKRLVRAFLARRVDAIVSLASTEKDVDDLLDAAKQVPIVLAVRSLSGAAFPSALCDDQAGGGLAASHLAARGHRVVCQIQGPRRAATFKNRAQGFSRVCRKAKLLESPMRIEVKWATTGEGKRTLEQILADPARPTGVFTHNDELAYGLIEAMRERGLRCPEDLAIVGFNNTEASKVLAVPLTTLDYPVAEVSRHAGHLVEALIVDRGTKWESKTFPPVLVERAST
ncbi:MAG: LacI family DNA-binding transcriptional regulator [Hyphomicrobiales bacterium]|nr:LacI family DNA-binding transcriptional regulator [Hyphomicrobiales bacterium]